MPFIQPTRGDVHVNRPLTNISVAFMQNQANFVADRVFPNVPVSKQSDRYFVIPRGEFNRNEMKKRVPGAQSAGKNYTLDNTPSYSCDVWAEHHDVADQVRSNADAPLDLDRQATELLTQQALICREVEWATAFFTAGVWATDFTPGTLWSAANSTPVEDVRTAMRTILQSTGFLANKFVCSRGVYDVLVDHPDIVGRIDRGQTPGGPARTNAQNLAALFEVDEVLVMNAIRNTAAEGDADSHAFIGGANDALLVYAAPNPGLMIPTGGYTFTWTGYLGATTAGTRMKRFRMEPEASDRIEIEQAFDQHLVSADLGYFFEDVVA